MSRLRLRAGTTFTLAIRRTHDNGATYDISNTDIRATIRGTGVQYPLEVSKTDPAEGWFVVSAPATATRFWQPGFYTWDILYADAGVVEGIPTSENLIIEVFTGATS